MAGRPVMVGVQERLLTWPRLAEERRSPLYRSGLTPDRSRALAAVAGGGGDTVIVSVRDGCLRVAGLRDGGHEEPVPLLRPLGSSIVALCGVDATHVLVQTDGEVILVEVGTGAMRGAYAVGMPYWTRMCALRTPWAAAEFPDGVHVFNLETGVRLPLSMSAGRTSITATAQAGAALICASSRELQVWRVPEGICVVRQRMPKLVLAAAELLGGLRLATAHNDHMLRLWSVDDAAAGGDGGGGGGDGTVRAKCLGLVWEQLMRALAFQLVALPDGTLAAAHDDGRITLWEPSSGACIGGYQPATTASILKYNLPTSLCCTADGRLVLAQQMGEVEVRSFGWLRRRPAVVSWAVVWHRW